MKYSFLNKRVFCILLFYSSIYNAQKIVVINNTDGPLTIKNGKNEVNLSSLEKKEFSETNKITAYQLNRLNRNINIFLEPNEKLQIKIENNKKLMYTGDKASLHEYINERLSNDTFGKTDKYYSIGDKKNTTEFKSAAEFLLLDILKKTQLSNILTSPDDKPSVKRLKNYIKYQWIYTIYLTINRKNIDNEFKKEILNYFFKKYLDVDIIKYSCNNPFRYPVIEILAKNKKLLQAEIPSYPIIEHTDNDLINQYLPPNCQKEYFQNKYDYLDHINGHNKEYYKKILIEKFNED